MVEVVAPAGHVDTDSVTAGELAGVAGGEGEGELLRLAAAGVVPLHPPAVGPDHQARHLTVAHARDGGVVGHTDVPLVQPLVVLDPGVLLPYAVFENPNILVYSRPTDVTDEAGALLEGDLRRWLFSFY